MSEQRMAEVTLVNGGGLFLDEQGKSHFIKGYGSGRATPLDLDPRIDLTAPILEQVQSLIHDDAEVERAAKA